MAGNETTLSINLDSGQVQSSLNRISEDTKRLSETIQGELGSKSAQSISQLEKQSERSSQSIGNYFRNLGRQLKDDFKAAFNVGEIMTGVGLARNIQQGVSAIFDMERAFGRLQARLNLTGSAFQDLKRNIGQNVANTGSSLETVLPAVEAVAGRGRVKDPGTLASISGMLGQANRVDPTSNLSGLGESIVMAIRNQGQQVTSQNFKAVLDSVVGARNAGGTLNLSDTAKAIEQFSQQGGKNPYLRGMGMRDYAGLTAAGSRSGEQGIQMIHGMMNILQGPGGDTVFKKMFGANSLQNGKINLAGMNTSGLGQYAPNVLSDKLGMDPTDIRRVLDDFKESGADMKRVAEGSNEAAHAFDQATDNMGAAIDKFKQRASNAARSIGDGLLSMIKAHDPQTLKTAAAGIGKTVSNNWGTLAGAGALTVGSAMLTGSGIRGLARGALGGAAASQMGVQPVFVTNASEISGSGSYSDFFKKTAEMATGGATAIEATGGGLGAAGLAALTATVGTLLASVYAGNRQANGLDVDPNDMSLGPGDQAAMLGQMAQGVKTSVKEGLSEATVKMTGPNSHPSVIRPQVAAP